MKTKGNKRKEYFINAGLGILVLLSYFILPYLQEFPFAIANINIHTVDTWIKICYLIFFETIILLIIGLLLKDSLKKDFYDIKKNHNTYFKDCLKYWLLALGIMMFSNAIINYFSTNGMASNEKAIQEMFKLSPIYIYFSAVIWAPIVEELTFRRAIRNIIKPDLLFIIISGIVFGGLHVLSTDTKSLIDLLYIIPYSAPGIAFAYMLQKYDNIFVSMGFHVMHNGILIALQFLLLIFV